LEKNMSQDEESLTKEEAQELRAVFQGSLGRKALGLILSEAEAIDSLGTLDLVSEEGVKKALAKQGTVRGMKRAVEILNEIGQEAEGDENEVHETKS